MFSRARAGGKCAGLGLILGGALLAATSGEAGILDVSWTAPTTNADGTPLTDLGSYRVYSGASTACPGATFVQVASPTPSPAPSQTVAVRLTGLTTGTLYNVSVTAVDTSGLESACASPMVSAAARIDFGVSPTGTVSFGNVNVGSTANQVITVSNTVGGTVSGTVSTSAPFSVVSGSPFTLVGLGASQAVTVRFTPTTAATASVNVSVAADGDTISRLATGTGVAVADTTPPTAPSTLAATAVGTTQINLSWIASTDNVGVTGYRVERCQGAGCTTFAQIATPTGVTYNDTTGLQANTTYSYRVRATDAAANLSGYSNTATATTLTVPPPPPPSQGLVAAYAFGEGAGAVTADGSGNANQGTITGATWTTGGKFGNALSFNGTSSFVSVPDAPTLDLGATGTMEAWVKLAAVSRWNAVIAKGGANSDPAHNYAIEVDDTNHVRCVVGNGISAVMVASATTLAVNQFYHLACTWDGTTVSLYINGGLSASVGQGLTPVGNTAPLSIGQFGGNSDRLSGVIDEVRIYNRALTLAQIQQDMNTPIGGSVPITFTDNPLAAGSTLIKAVHITELRTAIDNKRVAKGLTRFAWTDPTLMLGSTPAKVVHLTELRTALTQVYQAAGLTAPAYTDPTLVARVTVIKAAHLNELRTAVSALP